VILVCQLQRPSWERVQSLDASFKCLGMHDYGLEVFNADANVQLFLNSEIFEV